MKHRSKIELLVFLLISGLLIFSNIGCCSTQKNPPLVIELRDEPELTRIDSSRLNCDLATKACQEEYKSIMAVMIKNWKALLASQQDCRNSVKRSNRAATALME